MATILKFASVLCVFFSVLCKELHFKEDLEAKDNDTENFMDLFKNEDFFTKNERYARHIEVVTETVLEHLMSELKHQYSNKNYNPNNPIRRLVRNLKKMKRNEHNKIVKKRQKKKTDDNNKQRKTKTSKKGTTDKPSQKPQHNLRH